MTPITIRLIRAFEGPRHERLYRIWDAIAEYVAPDANVRWFANPGNLRHAQCFDIMWREEQEFDNTLVLFTEADFLPDLEQGLFNWSGLSSFRLPNQAAVSTMYCVRDIRSRKMIQHAHTPGGWFLALDKNSFPGPGHISFEGSPDPANDLVKDLRKFSRTAIVVPGEDGYPHHYGAEYPYGTHLFWSRHYHDDPKTRVSGFRLGDIQRKVDWRISQWIQDQPQDFQELLVNRFGSGILGSCSESIDLRSTFHTSFDKSVDWAVQRAKSHSSSSLTVLRPR